jgi:hypothetical protein
MAVLNETGVMDKITEAIAESLMKPPSNMDEETANKWAMGIMIGVSVAVSLVGIASSISNIVGSAATATAKVAAETTKNIVKQIIEAISKGVEKAMAPITKLANAAKTAVPVLDKAVNIAGATATIGQASAGISGAVQTRDAQMKQADSAELKKFLAKLQQQLEDEADRLQQMIAQMGESFSRAMKIIGGQSDQQEETIRQMGVAG